MFVQSFDGQEISEIGPLFVVLRRPFNYFYFVDHFDYWAHDFVSELHLRRHAR